ncbi:MAG: M48 family metalloprotease [Alphaproteobacteria bacterium]|nr:M48 family metalloprotease [Alphaproteobacteria bacterium]
MSDALPFINLAAETALLFGVALVAARFVSPRVAAFLYRCLFVIALLAPVAVLAMAKQASLLEVTADVPEPSPVITHANDPAMAPVLPAADTSISPAHTEPGYAMFVAALWLAGALFVLARYLLSLAYLVRAFGNGCAARDDIAATAGTLTRRLGITPPIGMLMSTEVAAPCTFGWMHPKILLPARLAESGDALEAVLAHELCHVRNRDAFWLMLGHLATALYWFNPLIWIVARNHRFAFELVCDADATENLVATQDYLTALLRTAQSLLRPSAPAGVGMSAQGLSRRVHALLERETPMKSLPSFAKLAAAAASALVLGAFATVDVVSARERIDTSLESLLKPDEAMLYLDVASGITVWGHDAGFMCGDDSHCQFTVRRGRDLRLTVAAERRVTWTGCKAEDDGRACVIRIDGTRAHVVAAR